MDIARIDIEVFGPHTNIMVCKDEGTERWYPHAYPASVARVWKYIDARRTMRCDVAHNYETWYIERGD